MLSTHIICMNTSMLPIGGLLDEASSSATNPDWVLDVQAVAGAQVQTESVYYFRSHCFIVIVKRQFHRRK